MTSFGQWHAASSACCASLASSADRLRKQKVAQADKPGAPSAQALELEVPLDRFKGVGAKTVACVMMFCLARDEFPVDTHVWRISKKLGWVPAKANRDDTYRHMNIRVPADIRSVRAAELATTLVHQQ